MLKATKSITVDGYLGICTERMEFPIAFSSEPNDTAECLLSELMCEHFDFDIDIEHHVQWKKYRVTIEKLG